MKKNLDEQSVAIIYDHLLTNHGGAELVLQTLLQAFPNAPIFTAMYNAKKTAWTKNLTIIPSFLQKFSFVLQQRELLDACTPIAIEQFDLSRFDIIISVTSSAVKGVITAPGQLHICYLLTPTRYLYQDRHQLSTQHPVLSLPGIQKLTDAVLNYLTWWDQVAAQRPDKIIAISERVAERTQQYYHRKVDAIIYPPVHIPEKITVLPLNQSELSRPFFLCFSRLVSYKRIDVAISACVETKQSLVIGGTGREEKKLQNMYPSETYVRRKSESVRESFATARKQEKNIIFLGTCSEAEKNTLFSECIALLMPGIEDFGITAVEANGFGKPAIVSNESGVAEVITDTVHGLHLRSQTVVELVLLLKKVSAQKFSTEKLQENAVRFSRDNFVRKFHNIVYQFLNEHSTITQ